MSRFGAILTLSVVVLALAACQDRKTRSEHHPGHDSGPSQAVSRADPVPVTSIPDDEPVYGAEPVPVGIVPDPNVHAVPGATTPLWMLIPKSWPPRCKALVRIVAAATRMYGDPHDPTMMYMAQVKQESRCDPTARSVVGAMGVLQIMPVTARNIQQRWGQGRLDPWDLGQNIKAGIWFDQQVRKFWNPDMRSWCDRVVLMWSGYNGGNGWWLKAQGRCTGYNSREECNGYYGMARFLPLVNPSGAKENLGYPKAITESWHSIAPTESCPVYDATRFLP